MMLLSVSQKISLSANFENQIILIKYEMNEFSTTEF